MLKETKKALSLELLVKHQERIKGLVSKIQNYKPEFHINFGYKSTSKAKLLQKQIQKEKKEDQLFEQNMKLIYRIETTGPKVQTRQFPQVKANLKRMKTVSVKNYSSYSAAKFKVKDVFRNQEELFNENMKIITNIESTGPKVACWMPAKIRKLNELKKLKKREQQLKILQKFKQISKQIKKIQNRKSIKNSSSITSLNKSIGR